MANFNDAIDVILQHEGGYVDHPNDPGGATNMGITFSLFKKYANEIGLAPSKIALRGMKVSQASYIYRKEFWDKMKGDRIFDQQLATQIFDFYVNAGVTAIKILQIQAGTIADGIVGNNTLAAINLSNPEDLFNRLKNARIDYYINLAERKPSMKVFLKGWLNRVNKFVYKKS